MPQPGSSTRTMLLCVTVTLMLLYFPSPIFGHGVGMFQMSIEADQLENAETSIPKPTATSIPKPTATRSFSFAKHFNHNMVLQRAPARAVLHGFSPAVEHKVLVQMVVNTNSYYYYTTHVKKSPDGDGGVWSVTLDPMEANVTAKFTVMSEQGILALHNVIFGDVWICSGQSNMQFTVSQMYRAKEEIADAKNYPNMRLMTVTKYQSDVPLLDLNSVDEAWTPPNAGTVGGADWTYFSAVCWMYGKAIHKATGIPIGLLDSNWGGTPVESWSSPDALKKCGMNGANFDQTQNPDKGPFNNEDEGATPSADSVLWNAMIYPLLQMPIYGAIWYQGEADAKLDNRRNHYNCTFPAMIADWRQKFHDFSQGNTNPTFPFGFVQLAPNEEGPIKSLDFPEIRWHQTADYGYVPNPKMPNVFMAVALDLPDFKSPYGSIHPRDKTDVGERLSLSGLSLAYGQQNLHQGPLPVKGYSVDETFVLDYGDKWSLDIRYYGGFEFFCSGGSFQDSWVPTTILKSSNSTVELYSNVCIFGGTPTKLRYAWRESPCDFKKCAVYSIVNSLPAPPFIANLAKDEKGGLLAKFDGPVNI